MEYFQFFILSNSSQMINPIQNLKVVISKNFSVQMPLQSFYSTQLSNLDPRILQSFENNISLLNREFPFNCRISIRLESGKCFLYVKKQSNLMHICAKCILLEFNKDKEYKQVTKCWPRILYFPQKSQLSCYIFTTIANYPAWRKLGKFSSRGTMSCWQSSVNSGSSVTIVLVKSMGLFYKKKRKI